MKKILFLLVLQLICICTSSTKACSAFMLKGEGYCVVGFNENWKSMPGLVFINKRGVHKENLSWKQLVSKRRVDEVKIKWTSLYGSVSFNLLGIDMPCYGVNEKGLFIVELYLDKTYSTDAPGKANMFWGQWIQYQLDNYATVGELIENLNSAPVIDWWPAFPGSHFFVSDKAGNTAAIALIEGKYVVSTGDKMPVPVLCNNRYQGELNELQQYNSFGGAADFDINTKKWKDRFAKAAHSIKSYNENPAVAYPVQYSWNLLDSIIPGEWQLVYDVNNLVLQFRSDLGHGIKQLDLSAIDFSNKSPVVYMDINADFSGDALPQFSKFTPAVNREYVAKGFPIGYANADFPKSEEYVILRKNIDKYVRRTF
ncbi:MAG: linear amide C-N hydrolase [Tannerella sp.]|jgi:penicillin V acylase-like amidase (Ntn superfamily)|nr:linear amide C-N hydrolase [Tannerella sp.]